MSSAAPAPAPTPGVIRRLDEVVVNRIAAGEVIQRPCNALKELLENSLDAGSNHIQVKIRDGGLKLLQITDNGTGIRQDDLSIVCERFTTSKLKSFDDLSSMATFGFRGEALASISHVARLTIVTKTRDSACGYKATYHDGKLKTGPKPCAANQGTQITVEDLFYNVPTRKRALRSPAEEFHRVADVVSKYAIHNAGVAFALKKEGGAGGDNAPLAVRTQKQATVQDNVTAIFGRTIGKELVSVSKKDERLKFEMSALISNVNFNSAKKFNMLLFINHRLVESSALKRSLEAVYSAYLPKGTHPFVYLSLEIEPSNVDVNVHPTKHEVHFLHQDEIIESVQQAVDAKLLGSNASRNFYAQPVLPAGAGAGAAANALVDAGSGSGSGSKSTAVAEKHMVRTDAREQKLDKYLTVTPKETRVERKREEDKLEAMEIDEQNGSFVGQEQSAEPHLNQVGPRESSSEGKTPAGTESYRQQQADVPRREIKLDSLKRLRQQVIDRSHEGLRQLISEHSFVGVVSRQLSLIQHNTKLYLVNNPQLTEQLFYQVLLQDFGNLGALRLTPTVPEADAESEAPSVRELARMALDSSEAGWTEADGDKDELAEYVEKLLVEKAEMLDDYFSLEFDCSSPDGRCRLISIPLLLDETYVPYLGALPLFIMRLATEVNWDEEEACFHTLCKEIARFYAFKKSSGTRYDAEQHCDDKSDKYKQALENVVFPAAKRRLRPAKESASDMTFVQVANLPDLYKVFERC